MINITMEIDKDNNVWKWLQSQENKLINAGHIGTHIDVYKKTDVPKEYFKTKAIVIDCSNYRYDEEIGIEVLENLNIEANMFIIFKTNIQSTYSYGSDVYINEHHELSWDLINYLIDKKVAFIGIDCAGVKRGSEHFKADVKAEENKTYIIENLDLGQVDRGNIENIDVYTSWINNPFATGLSTVVLLDIK